MNHLDRVAVWDNPACSITYFDNRDMEFYKMSEDELIVFMTNRLKSGPMKGFNYSLHNKSVIPKDRKDRDCWALKGNKVEVDQAKMDLKSSKLNKRQSILTKLGITGEELKTLIR